MRRRPLPPFAAIPAQHRGRVSLRNLLRDDWRLAFGALALVACSASAEAANPTHRAEHAVVGAVIDVVTIEAERIAAPRWTHRHPVFAQVIAGLVVGTAAVAKEAWDVHHGSEELHHQFGDIAFTEAGGVAAGIGFTYSVRF